jgi:DNA-directed RNA polymerase subunit RPC12/RpoP
MNNFVLVLVATAAGGLLAGFLSHWADKRYLAPAPSASEEQRFPRTFLLKVAAITVMIAWLSILAFLVSIALAKTGFVSLTEPVALSMLGSLVSGAALYIVFSLMLRCPKCHHRVLVQENSSPPYTEEIWKMNGWASVVLRVVFMRRFRCMHCGQRYSA